MPSSYVGFLDPYGHPNSGVDHLGMRVAGEAAYSKLIDFITTVAWRPRYFSFLSWALQKAWEDSAAKSKNGTIKVNRTLQRSILKRLDYTVAASTLLLDSSAQRIAGSDAINKSVIEPKLSSVEVREDHLRSSGGSYNIYVGSMRGLGLVETASNVDRPSVAGKKIAELYESSLGEHKEALLSAAKDKDQFSTDELRRIARVSCLTAFNDKAMPDSVSDERLELRKMLFGPAAPSGRRLSVGIVLRAHNLLPGKVTLDDFRSLTLLHGIRTENGDIPFELPAPYHSIMPHWASYQAHAYATYALEGLLGIVLKYAHSLELQKGEGVDCGQLVTFVANEVVSDKWAIFDRQEGMRTWWDLALDAFGKLVLKDVEKTYQAELSEPELYTSLKSRPDSAALSLMLFFFAVIRLETLYKKHGDKAWIGSQDPYRLPPQVFIDDFRDASEKGVKVIDYIQQILLHYVINQHHKNAMRKLAAVPTLDTSKFSWEGDRLVPNGSHQAGTSNPRFENAVFCLTDLGYLDKNGGVTPDGYSLIEEIEGQSA
jgi:hypothetical protein